MINQIRIFQTLSSDDILYAVGQGALAVECRSNDHRILQMLQKLCCLHTQCKILTERSFLKTLGGGCSAPVAVVTNLKRKSAEPDGANGHHELHITGAVWSLDGTIEVLSDLNCSLNLNSIFTPVLDEEIPSKRARICKTPEPTGKTPAKPASPPIVDDTKLPIPSGSDMSALLKIHGDLLKKCPYAAHHQAAGDSDKCPLNFAVGQDVMGQCPYLNSEQKILASDVKSTICSENNQTEVVLEKCPLKVAAGQDVMAQCPYLSAESKNQASNSGNSSQSIVGQNAINKCPFSTAQTKDTVDKSAPTALPINAEITKVCPFLSTSSSTTTDHKPTKSNKSTDTEESDDTVDETTLYCGLYRHQCYNIEWFERCEQLGQSLAKNLIERGANVVMEQAQLEIRKAI